MTDILDSTPNPSYVPIAAAFIRGAIQIGSGMGFLVGAYSDSQITMAATGLVAFGTLCWSAYQKIRAQRALHIAAANPAGATPPKMPS